MEYLILLLQWFNSELFCSSKIWNLILLIFFLFWWRAPQQMLQTHRSLKAYYATMWWSFSFFRVMEHRWNEKLRGENRSTRGGKTCLSATLTTTNSTWTDPGSNPDLRGERPANNRLSHDTAFKIIFKVIIRIVVLFWIRKPPNLVEALERFGVNCWLRKLLNKFSWNLVLGNFTKIYRHIKYTTHIKDVSCEKAERCSAHIFSMTVPTRIGLKHISTTKTVHKN
jgi:hypothetical protein